MRLMRLDPSLNATKGCLYVFCANACFDILFGSCRNMAMMPGTARNGGANCCQSKRKMYRSLRSITDSERESERERVRERSQAYRCMHLDVFGIFTESCRPIFGYV